MFVIKILKNFLHALFFYTLLFIFLAFNMCNTIVVLVYTELIIQVGPIWLWHVKIIDTPLFIIIGFIGLFEALSSFWS